MGRRVAMVVLAVAVAMQLGSAPTLAADDETPPVATLQWPGIFLGDRPVGRKAVTSRPSPGRTEVQR